MWPTEPSLVIFLGASVVTAGSPVHAAWALDPPVAVPVQGGTLARLIDALRNAAAQCAAEGDADRKSLACVVVSEYWLATAALTWQPGGGREDALAALGSAGHEVDERDLVLIDDAPWGADRRVMGFDIALMDEIRALGLTLGYARVQVVPLSDWAWMSWQGLVPEGIVNFAVIEPAVGDSGARHAVIGRLSEKGRPIEVVARHWKASGSLKGLVAALERLGWRAQDSSSEVLVLSLDRSGLGNGDHAARPAALTYVELLEESRPSGRRVLPERSVAAKLSGSALSTRIVLGRRFNWTRTATILAMVASIATGWQVIQLWASASQVAVSARSVVPAIDRLPGSPADVQRLHAVGSEVLALGFPLTAILMALEPPQDIAAGLLALDLSAPVSGSSAMHGAPVPTLKVHVESPDALHMTRYVGFLDGRHPLGRAWLVHHERTSTAASPVYRYTVEVMWRQ